MRVDDRYLDGIYYDAEVGTFVEIDRPEDSDEAAILSEIGPAGTDTVLSGEEWAQKHEDLLPVPEEAIENPVEYYEHVIEKLRRRASEEFDVGFFYADQMTQVTELKLE